MRKTRLRKNAEKVTADATLHVRITEQVVIDFINDFASSVLEGVEVSPAVALRIIATRAAKGLPIVTPKR